MNTRNDIGKLQEVHIHDCGFKKGNYFVVRFQAKGEECMEADLNPDELDMAAVAFLRAVIKAGRWLNIAGEVIDILGGKEVLIKDG